VVGGCWDCCEAHGGLSFCVYLSVFCLSVFDILLPSLTKPREHEHEVRVRAKAYDLSRHAGT
jgi:hypothetical protein